MPALYSTPRHPLIKQGKSKLGSGFKLMAGATLGLLLVLLAGTMISYKLLSMRLSG